jgi:hypothetical protein
MESPYTAEDATIEKSRSFAALRMTIFLVEWDDK